MPGSADAPAAAVTPDNGATAAAGLAIGEGEENGPCSRAVVEALPRAPGISRSVSVGVVL
jgi:hypothetical protein